MFQISKLSIFRIRNNILISKNKINTCANDLQIEYLKQAFSQFNRDKNHYDYLVSQNKNILKLKRSSVLIPISTRLVKNSKGNYIQKSFFTFTKRTDAMKSFKGQVCFVGGRRDPDDRDDVETALREAKEEIGIEPSQITILGQLSPVMTTNGNLITPVIGYFDSASFEAKINHDEVEFIFELPTDRFLVKDHYKSEVYKHKENEYIVHYFEDKINDKLITTWGATALLSIYTSCIIHSRIPEFEMDTQNPMTNENIFNYLDFYLLKKSQKALDYLGKKN